jgi:hypothetical protein
MAAVCHMAEEPAPTTLTVTVAALTAGAAITAAANRAADRKFDFVIRISLSFIQNVDCYCFRTESDATVYFAIPPVTPGYGRLSAINRQADV